MSGVALLVASVIAGELWARIGGPATFYGGAGFAGLALLALLVLIWTRPSTYGAVAGGVKTE